MKSKFHNIDPSLSLLFLNTFFQNRFFAITFFSLFISNEVFAQTPLANFTGTPISGCPPFKVDFKDLSTNSPLTYFWDFGNGSTSTIKDPSAIYINPGTYSVKLTVTNLNGTNTLTRDAYITVYPSPQVQFSTPDVEGCSPLKAKFTDQSTAGTGTVNNTWEWNFGDGAISNVQNPEHTYFSAGNFPVTLKVTNDKGCSKILNKTAFIKVSAGVVAAFTKTTPNVCALPVDVNFTDQSTGPGTLSYFWNFGDGSTSTQKDPLHTYTASGFYNVSLTVTSSLGCNGSITKNNEVIIGSSSTSFYAPNNSFVNDVVNFTNTSSPLAASQSWNFGDGTSSNAQSPVKIYSAPGTYNVQLTNNYGNCTFNFTKSIIIEPKAGVDFSTTNNLGCKIPHTVNFQNTSTSGVSWLWNFGNGATSTAQNPSYTYNDFGNYDVTLIVTKSNGVKDTLVKKEFIKLKKPVIEIKGLPSRGCLPHTISPVPVVTLLDTVVSYLWEFGDGSTSASQFPTHTYSGAGTYTVKLTITTSLGCTESITVSAGVKMGTPPVVNFSYNQLVTCVFTPVQFTDLSSFGDEWKWDFGDGTPSELQNPVHEFALPGKYAVKLTVINNGCAVQIQGKDSITVLPPVAVFSATPNCTNRYQFTFSDKSKGPLSWLWDFGDGTTSTAQNPPPHNFPALGLYQVTLKVTNGGCSDTSLQLIKTIDENPDFASDFSITCREKNVTFTTKNTNPLNLNNYYWDFGDKINASTKETTIVHAYDSAGTTTVTLITTDLNGCKDTLIKPTYIRTNGPVANFNAIKDGGCIGFTAGFNDLSFDDGIHPIVLWDWKFGDNTSQSFSSPPFTHVYNSAGVFSVTLALTDAAGCRDTLTIKDIISSTDPTVNFYTADSATCPGSLLDWKVESNSKDLTHLWSFSDGTTSTFANPPKSFAATGIYSVKLVITDKFGCPDSLTRTNYINVKSPTASFNADDTASFCTPFEVHFTNTSTYYHSQTWTLETGVISTLNKPEHYYNTPGSYNVELIVTSPGGCRDTAYRKIILYDTAGTKLNYSPLEGCKPRTVSLTANTIGPANFLWDFGDGQSQVSSLPSVSHLYQQFGKFVPKVILQDPTGCLTPISGTETLNMLGATTKFGIDKNFFCGEGLINILDSTTTNDPIILYKWDFGDGNTSNLNAPSHYYTTPGIYNISLYVKTALGCEDSIRKDNILRIAPKPDIRIDGDTSICVYKPLHFFGNLNTPDPTVNSWVWSFGNGANSNSQNPPEQIFNFAGNFKNTLVVTNQSGCKDTATLNIRIHPLPIVTLPAEITTFAGTPVAIPAKYSGNMSTYLWTPPLFLDCTDCPKPTVTPEYNQLYTVNIADSNNCESKGSILIKTLCKSASLFMPNTFSPNDDGSNDVFYPRGKLLARTKILRIFNRWGEIVFERYDFPVNDPMYGWDGRWKGKTANADVYIYQVEVYCLNGELISSKGNITLIR